MIFSVQSNVKAVVGKAFKAAVTVATVSAAMCGTAQAIDITPNLSLGATGWTTDRYQPNSFANVGNFAGRNNVLGIGIDTAQGASQRSPSYTQAQFYNTQGMIQPLTGGAGSTISADLYIDAAWSNAANGNVRTDIWGITSDGTRTVADPYSHRVAYPRIGFTNYGDAGARLRVSDDSVVGGWVDLATTVNYGSWMGLAITFTGSSIVYAVNGAAVYTDSSINDGLRAPTGFSDVLMQAYNFNDASVAGAVGGNYTAHWTNTMAQPVPEPETYMLMFAGLLTMGVVARRRKAKAA
jgi:PEP-CTERM motif